jgi:alpha-tubulin suppressor-like RCC1 family protein
MQIEDVCPCLVFSIRYRIKSISAGRMHSIATTDESMVFAWGCGDDGALGMGDTSSSTIPQRITSLDGKMVVKVSCGSRHTLALSAQGLVFSWGWNSYGQLGLGDTKNRVTPTVIPSLATMRVSMVCSGYRHSLVVVSNQRREVGSLWGWGWNQYGQVGVKKGTGLQSFSTSASVLEPVKIMDEVCKHCTNATTTHRHSDVKFPSSEVIKHALPPLEQTCIKKNSS